MIVEAERIAKDLLKNFYEPEFMKLRGSKMPEQEEETEEAKQRKLAIWKKKENQPKVFSAKYDEKHNFKSILAKVQLLLKSNTFAFLFSDFDSTSSSVSLMSFSLFSNHC